MNISEVSMEVWIQYGSEDTVVRRVWIQYGSEDTVVKKVR